MAGVGINGVRAVAMLCVIEQGLLGKEAL